MMENKENKNPCSAELNDDALDAVSGGAGAVANYHTCDHFVCCFCGKKKTNPQELNHICEPNGVMESVCSLCELAVGSGTGWVCTHS